MKRSKKLIQEYQKVSECYRTLRTNLQFSLLNDDHPIFLFVSHEINEQMIPTISNLGLMFAKIGKRVLLIDGDGYRPRLHRMFNLNKDPGMSNVLLHQISIPEAIQEVEHNLHVLPSGTLVSNPSVMMQSASFSQLLLKLKENYDVILMASPPMEMVNDAAILATQVSGVLLLVQEGKSQVAKLKQSQKQLNQVQANVIGAIMTNSSNYSAYYYDYA